MYNYLTYVLRVDALNELFISLYTTVFTIAFNESVWLFNYNAVTLSTCNSNLHHSFIPYPELKRDIGSFLFRKWIDEKILHTCYPSISAFCVSKLCHKTDMMRLTYLLSRWVPVGVSGERLFNTYCAVSSTRGNSWPPILRDANKIWSGYLPVLFLEFYRYRYN